MSLWVDKYRPKNLKALSYNDDLTNFLSSLAMNSKDLPHLLLYGPNSSGKKTRCMSLLDSIFGSQVYRLKIDVRRFVTPSNRKLELNVISSPYHLEITPSDMGNNDRIVIQELLKEVAQMEQVDFQDSSSGIANRFKCVIINEANSLTRDAQAALRRTMEKYSKNIRLILLCDSMSSIISPIRSRCLMIRSPAPTTEDIVRTLKEVAMKENVSIQADSIFDKIATESNGNMRIALLMLESMSLSNEMQLKESTPVIKPDWMVVIVKLANNIRKERSVRALIECRAVLYDLLAHCIPAKIILQEITFALINDQNTPESSKVEIVDHASVFDERLSLGNKPIFHLEGFVAKVMCTLDK